MTLFAISVQCPLQIVLLCLITKCYAGIHISSISLGASLVKSIATQNLTMGGVAQVALQPGQPKAARGCSFHSAQLNTNRCSLFLRMGRQPFPVGRLLQQPGTDRYFATVHPFMVTIPFALSTSCDCVAQVQEPGPPLRVPRLAGPEVCWKPCFLHASAVPKQNLRMTANPPGAYGRLNGMVPFD